MIHTKVWGKHLNISGVITILSRPTRQLGDFRVSDVPWGAGEGVGSTFSRTD